MRVQQWLPPKVRLPALPRGLAALAAVGAWLAWLALGGPALGQTRPEKKAEPPAPEEVVRTTADGVQLALTYYPGTKRKQEAPVPIVLLHGWKQSRVDYKRLAPLLQAQGYAVIVPDLRGHGASKRIKGSEKTVEPDRPSPSLSKQMLTQDMKVIKEFLWKKNNEGELNIDKLCLVGSEMGASLALNVALADAMDQDRNNVPGPTYRTGRFVKALVLISPTLSFAGLPVPPAMRHPYVQRNIAMFIIVGEEDPKALDAAKRIHGMVEKFHPEPGTEDKVEQQTLFYVKLKTKLQGTRLLDPNLKFDVPGAIAQFIDLRLVKSDEAKEWPWRERKFPHEQ
jgi:pimeloyl-ACP methyl ester carboxylesterase